MDLKPHTAHVGYTKSNGDHERTVDAEDRLALELTPDADEDDECFDLYKNADYLNLDKGRDFLNEDTTYDIVILHYIFARKDINDGLPPHLIHPLTKMSATSSQQNWHKRLISTQAQFIFAYGGGNEVTKYFLGNIPGYELCDTNHHSKTMYKKI
jgi:hypothetical protein